jgi:hypothetical protein
LRGLIVDEGSGPPHSLHHAHMAQSCADAMTPMARLAITS